MRRNSSRAREQRVRASFVGGGDVLAHLHDQVVEVGERAAARGGTGGTRRARAGRRGPRRSPAGGPRRARRARRRRSGWCRPRSRRATGARRPARVAAVDALGGQHVAAGTAEVGGRHAELAAAAVAAHDLALELGRPAEQRAAPSTYPTRISSRMRDDETGSPSSSNSGADVTAKPRSSPRARSTSTSPPRRGRTGSSARRPPRRPRAGRPGRRRRTPRRPRGQLEREADHEHVVDPRLAQQLQPARQRGQRVGRALRHDHRHRPRVERRDRRPARRAPAPRSIAVWITRRWPRCTPSKVPSATDRFMRAPVPAAACRRRGCRSRPGARRPAARRAGRLVVASMRGRGITSPPRA